MGYSPKIFKVKVIRCSDSGYWYNSHRGEVFVVRKSMNSDDYVVTDQRSDRNGWFLSECDCKVIDDEVNFFTVKITKCTNQSDWYECNIGGTFDVRESEYDDYYMVIDEDNKDSGWLIKKEDCEVINDKQNTSKPHFVVDDVSEDERVTALRTIQSMCHSEDKDSIDILTFKLDILNVVISGLYF